MKNAGLIVAIGLGVYMWTKSKSVKVPVLTDPEVDPDAEVRQVSSEQVLSGGIPYEKGISMSVSQLSALQGVCNGLAQLYPWMMAYLKDKENMLPDTSEAQIKEAIAMMGELNYCSDIMCSAVGDINPNKEFSDTLINSLNDSATCIMDLQEATSNEFLASIVYPPQNIPNFFGN